MGEVPEGESVLARAIAVWERRTGYPIGRSRSDLIFELHAALRVKDRPWLDEDLQKPYTEMASYLQEIGVASWFTFPAPQ